MNQLDLEKIKQIIQEFFNQAGLAVDLEVKNPQDATVPIILKTEEPQILIGERGQTLIEIQRLLKSILRKQIAITTPFYIDIDVNDYKKKKIEYLKEIAKTTADEVALTKKEKELSPMPPYERRIVHMALASRTDVVTESIGQEPQRKVVIRSYP